jgi:hypothetical protein
VTQINVESQKVMIKEGFGDQLLILRPGFAILCKNFAKVFFKSIIYGALRALFAC